MAGLVDAQLQGAAPLQRGLAAAPAHLAAGMRATMERSLLLIEADARRAVPQDTRALMNSIHHQIAATPQAVTGTVGPALRYGVFVERGTRPHWPPAGPLQGWAQRHGIPVFLVQRAIARKGTRPRPFLLPAFEKHRAAIAAAFERLGGVVVQAIARGGR